MNIEQLVERGKTKDKYAINDIMKKFTPLILKTVNSIYINGYDRDDLIQIGYISIIKSIENYDANRNSNFTAYVSMAIRKNYYYEIREKIKQNYEISYDAILQNGTHLDLLNRGENYNIEEQIIQRERYDKLKIALSKLSNDERELLFYLLENGHGALREYSKMKNIKYETLKKRKKKILEKLKKQI